MRFHFLSTHTASSAVGRKLPPPKGVPAPFSYLTLRTKGILACAVLLLYVLGVSAYVAVERVKLQRIVEQMHAVHDQHEMLTEVNAGLTHSIVTLQNVLNNDDIASRSLDIQLDLASFSRDLATLRAEFTNITDLTERFNRQSADLSKGATRESLIALRDIEQALAATLEQMERGVEYRSNVLRKEYAELNGYITVFVVGTNLFGLGAFGIVVALFLSTLARDVNALKSRAMAIVNGYKGPPFEVRRGDEVGALMEALNRMQSQLRQREHQQVISMQQRFHQEKMAAVGSLAATVAHEVSNPINSISGIAQHTIEALRSHERLDHETLRSNAELTLTQTERIGSIMRRLSDLSAPRSPDPEPIDVNELVRLTCSFIRYDRRLRHISLVTELDHDLPAVRAVADHLTQILMNLLINAADAHEGRDHGNEKPTVIVSTCVVSDEVILSVSDNGHGMDPAVMAHAFEESFTTKPVARGRGIGLHLCKTLIEEVGGRIELESTLRVGTTARVCLPLRNEISAVVA